MWSGYIYLGGNWSWTFGTNTNIKVNKTLYLDLNGHTLTLKGASTWSAIDIYNGSSLYLIDSSSGKTGKIVMDSGAKFDHAIYMQDSGGLFEMRGGTISGFKNATNGGAVYVGNGCTFNMKGGTISDCTLSSYGSCGGGVYVESNGTFNMSGGTIQNCKADRGGAVYLLGREKCT